MMTKITENLENFYDNFQNQIPFNSPFLFNYRATAVVLTAPLNTSYFHSLRFLNSPSRLSNVFTVRLVIIIIAIIIKARALHCSLVY